MAYIHELEGWPNLTWDSGALAGQLAHVRHAQGKHLGKMEALGFELKSEANLTSLTRDVVTSSAIEGENLSTDEVRSSIARRLGLSVAGLPRPSRAVEGVVDMMLEATQKFDQPLTPDRLFGWHSALFPTGRSGLSRITVGAWRTDESGPMVVVSGSPGRERVHFQAPAAGRLADEMNRFLEWFNSPIEIDPVLKAGVAHFWFVTIHPFDDGNGRIARAIADMVLARADSTKSRFYSMSSSILDERKEYYVTLETAQRGSLDITAWLAWFLGCLGRAIAQAETTLGSVLRKAKLWKWINRNPVSDRQRKVVNRMLDDWKGPMTTVKYAKIAKCSHDTALRDIKELVDREILQKSDAGGRSTSYQLVDPDTIDLETA